MDPDEMDFWDVWTIEVESESEPEAETEIVDICMINDEAADVENSAFKGSMFGIGKVELGKAIDFPHDESMFGLGNDENILAAEQRVSIFDIEKASAPGEEVDRRFSEGRDPWSPGAVGKGAKSRVGAFTTSTPQRSTS